MTPAVWVCMIEDSKMGFHSPAPSNKSRDFFQILNISGTINIAARSVCSRELHNRSLHLQRL